MGFGLPLHHKYSMKLRLAIFHWNGYKWPVLGKGNLPYFGSIISSLKIYTADDISNGCA